MAKYSVTFVAMAPRELAGQFGPGCAEKATSHTTTVAEVLA
jgi:hypothetical protein